MRIAARSDIAILTPLVLEGPETGRYMIHAKQEFDFMAIDTDTARRVAKLARIAVEDEALPVLAKELSGILGFMEQLNEVDIEGVEPMTSVTPQRLKRREDVVTDGAQQEAVLANAPDAREGFFAVPKVVE